MGALIGAGLNYQHAELYAEGIRRGSSVVSIRVDEELVSKAQGILRQNGAVDPDEREAEYREDGWDHFDEASPAAKGNDPDSGRVRYTDRIHY